MARKKTYTHIGYLARTWLPGKGEPTSLMVAVRHETDGTFWVDALTLKGKRVSGLLFPYATLEMARGEAEAYLDKLDSRREP